MFYFWSSYDGPGTKVFSLFKLLNRFYFLKGNVFCWWSENWFNMSVVPCFCVISTGQNYHRKLLYISSYDSGSTTERYSCVNKTIEGITETPHTASYREYQPPSPLKKTWFHPESTSEIVLLYIWAILKNDVMLTFHFKPSADHLKWEGWRHRARHHAPRGPRFATTDEGWVRDPIQGAWVRLTKSCGVRKIWNRKSGWNRKSEL